MQHQKISASIDAQTFKEFAGIYFGKKIKDLDYEGILRIRISYIKKLGIAAHSKHTPPEVPHPIFSTKEIIDQVLHYYEKVKGIRIVQIEYPIIIPPKIIFE